MPDRITGSKGPTTIDKDPLDEHPGDTIATSEGPSNIGAEPYVGKVGGEGDRDWTDVNNRVIAVSGVNVQNYGDINYTEDGDISDDDVAKMDADFEKAGAPPAAGRRVALAAKQMGYGIRFTARKGK